MNRHKISAIILSSFVLAISSCDNATDTPPVAETSATVTTAVAPPAPEQPINKLHWLAGWWQNVDKGISFEEWKLTENGNLSGTSGYIKGKDTIVSETVSLEQRGDAVIYIPIVKDQNNGQPVPFTLTSAIGDSFVFENPKHDFPDKITYKKLSPTSLVASISGKMNGVQRSILFPLTKIR